MPRKYAYPYCDKCVEIRKARVENDFEKYLNLTGLMDQVKAAHDFIQDPKNQFDEDRIGHCQEFLWDIQHEFGIFPTQDMHCPFKFKPPNLNLPIRRQYKLHCFHCKTRFRCPGQVVYEKGTPLCDQCYCNTFEDENEYYHRYGEE